MPTASENAADRSTQQLPRAALQFRSQLKFAAAADAGSKDESLVPFTMTARTGDAIDNYYWGRVVHDMAGMQLSKPVLATDYCHDPDEILGFADKFDTTSGDLIVSGNLTPMGDDRASEVIHKEKLGVPYEASIDFSGDEPVVEYIPMDVTVPVNGKAFTGPGIVIREWTLRALAICPYGADSNTATEFADRNETVSVTTINLPAGALKMSKTIETTPLIPAAAVVSPATIATPATAQLSAAAATAAPATPSVEKPHQKFTSLFGAIGATWFLEDKSIEDCTREFTTALKTEHTAAIESLNTKFASEKTALQSQLDAANTKLAAIGRGDKGVTFSNADGGNVDPQVLKLTQNLGEGLGRFAASIKLPGQK